MISEQNRKLAHTIVHYSTEVTPGDIVFINAKGIETRELAEAVMIETLNAGGVPYMHIEDDRHLRRLLLNGKEETFKKLGEIQLSEMEKSQVFIGIRGTDNVFELSDAPKEQLDLYDKYITKPVHIEQRVKHTRWVVMRYPNFAMCQLAQKSTEAFQNFYYEVCCLDYARMNEASMPLVELMNKTSRVRIIAKDTDLQFSIEGIPAKPCCGQRNIPDGESFTAPVKDSIQGTILFNTPSIHEGILYDTIKITFKDGKAVNAESGANSKRLRAVLDSDPGASYVGEFALGFNPFILEPMKDILFDEKICGSLHMAMGACYDETPNGNESALHWDLIQIQRPEYGGGEIYFDDVLIRKDGRFILNELQGLNPENLK